jgi:hypothetical protein
MKKMLKGFIVLVLLVVLVGGAVAGEKSAFTPYGFVRTDVVYNTTNAPVGDWHLWAPAENSDAADQSVYTMTARHSRIGVNICGGGDKETGKVSGKIEVDFAGGFANSSTAARQPILRLRHAWVEYAKGKMALRIGQDWALISGPFPGTTSFVVGAGKGNLWMRYPQIKFTYDMKPLKVSASINRPMAGNTTYNAPLKKDFDPIGDGELTGMPWFMGRAWYTMGTTTLSASGHFGQEQIADSSATLHDMTTYSINADVVSKLNKLTLTGRFFMGENLNQFFGGVFQGFTKTMTEVKNVPSFGGWASAAYKVSDKFSVTLGGGMDDPDEDEGALVRTKNTWIFSKFSYSMMKNLKFDFGVDQVTTEYSETLEGSNIRIGFNTTFTF